MGANILGRSRPALALAVSRFADGLGSGILLLAIPLYVVELRRSPLPLPEPVLIGIAVALYGLIASALQPLTGMVSDQAGRRKPFILAGFALMAVTSLGFALTTRIGELLLLRSIQGLGLALVIPPSRALMVTLAGQRSRGQGFGFFRALRMLGLAIGPVLSGFLQVGYGFTSVFLAGAAAMLLGLISLGLGVREDPRRPATRGTRSSPAGSNRALTAGRSALITALLLVGAVFSVVAALKGQFDDRLQISVIGFGAAFSAYVFSRLLFEVPMGALSDRIGRKKLILIGLTVLAPATALLGIVQTTGQLMSLRILQGIASAAIAGPALILASDFSQAGKEALEMGVVGMGFGLGSAVGPLVGGVFVLVSFELPFLVLGLIALLAAWAVQVYVPEAGRAARAT